MNRYYAFDKDGETTCWVCGVHTDSFPFPAEEAEKLGRATGDIVGEGWSVREISEEDYYKDG